MRGGLILKLLAWGLALSLVVLPIVGVLNGWFAGERWPVRALQVEAEYNHVSAEEIRAAVANHVGNGFFATRLDELQAAVAALPWVEKAEARKHWPDTILLHITELQPVARWGAHKLISADSRIFAVPGAENMQGLPRLAGPDNALANVIAFYASAQKILSGSGMTVNGVELSERGSWKLALSNGSELELGREQPEQRLQRFIYVYPRLLAGHTGNFEKVDLRYSNGFAIKWPEAPASVTPPAVKKPQPAAPEPAARGVT
jgi:cell division protein FtsQ